MLVFGNKRLEQIVNGIKEKGKPSRRVRKLRKKAMKVSRVF